MGFYLLITDENGRDEYCDEVWDGLKHAGAREFWEKIEDICTATRFLNRGSAEPAVNIYRPANEEEVSRLRTAASESAIPGLFAHGVDVVVRDPTRWFYPSY